MISSTYTGDGRSPADRIARIDALDDAVGAAAVESGLAAPALLTRLRFPALTRVPGGAVETALVHRSGAAEHLEIVAGTASDDGVLIPEQLAADAGVGPGGVLELTRQNGDATVRVPVSGVYVLPVEPVPGLLDGAGLPVPPALRTGRTRPGPAAARRLRSPGTGPVHVRGPARGRPARVVLPARVLALRGRGAGGRRQRRGAAAAPDRSRAPRPRSWSPPRTSPTCCRARRCRGCC